MTLSEMRRRMSSAEFLEWQRYYNAEPFGAPREEIKHGDLISSLWQLHGGKDSPAALRRREGWMYASSDAPIDYDDPDAEAAAMLAKIGG